MRRTMRSADSDAHGEIPETPCRAGSCEQVGGELLCPWPAADLLWDILLGAKQGVGGIGVAAPPIQSEGGVLPVPRPQAVCRRTPVTAADARLGGGDRRACVTRYAPLRREIASDCP
ncbi:hypothetical protein GCM10023223_44950 [Stackebrandtia albiflava]